MSRYIDAEELMEIFKTLKWDASCSIVDDMPTVDVVEVVHGEWIDRGKDKAIRWECSVCGRRDVHVYNYCPNCGAMMSESLKVHEIGKSLVDGIQAGIKGEKDG